MNIKKVKILMFVFMICLSLSGCNHKQDHDIYILYTNDMHCNARGEEIGLAGVRAFKEQYKNTHTYVSLVDCGDFAEGNAYGEFHKGLKMVMLMNDCGYDVVALGNQDFMYGVDRVQRMLEDAKFDVVDCNIKYLGKDGYSLSDIKPYVIKKYGHTKVAFVGVMTPDILTEGKPSYDALLENGELAYSFYKGNEGQDLWEQVQKTVNKVRKKVDYVIVLSHLGIETKSEPYTSFEMIANTEGIDVVIDGHSHTVMHGEAVANKNGEGVVITSTGQNLENIGVLILGKDGTYTTTLYPRVEEKDPWILAELDEIDDEIAKYMN